MSLKQTIKKTNSELFTCPEYQLLLNSLILVNKCFSRRFRFIHTIFDVLRLRRLLNRNVCRLYLTLKIPEFCKKKNKTDDNNENKNNLSIEEIIILFKKIKCVLSLEKNEFERYKLQDKIRNQIPFYFKSYTDDIISLYDEAIAKEEFDDLDLTFLKLLKMPIEKKKIFKFFSVNVSFDPNQKQFKNITFKKHEMESKNKRKQDIENFKRDVLKNINLIVKDFETFNKLDEQEQNFKVNQIIYFKKKWNYSFHKMIQDMKEFDSLTENQKKQLLTFEIFMIKEEQEDNNLENEKKIEKENTMNDEDKHFDEIYLKIDNSIKSFGQQILQQIGNKNYNYKAKDIENLKLYMQNLKVLVFQKHGFKYFTKYYEDFLKNRIDYIFKIPSSIRELAEENNSLKKNQDPEKHKQIVFVRIMNLILSEHELI